MPGGWSWGDDGDDPASLRAAQNSRRQAIRLGEYIREGVADLARFVLTADCVRDLNRIAVEGLVEHAGEFRTADVQIIGSRHQPPSWSDVPGLVTDLCAHVNEGGGDAIELAAYTLWRLNWIHPFEDGNGRTARAASYLVLCVALGNDLPGEVTIPERLVWHKIKYQRALEAADQAWAAKVLDVSVMTTLLRDLLVAQLTNES